MLYNFLDKKGDVVLNGFTNPSEYDAFTNDGKNAANLNKALTIASVKTNDYIKETDFENRDAREIVFTFNIVNSDTYGVVDVLRFYINQIKCNIVKVSSSYDGDVTDDYDVKDVFMHIAYRYHHITWQDTANNLVGFLVVAFFDTGNGWYHSLVTNRKPKFSIGTGTGITSLLQVKSIETLDGVLHQDAYFAKRFDGNYYSPIDLSGYASLSFEEISISHSIVDKGVPNYFCMRMQNGTSVMHLDFSEVPNLFNSLYCQILIKYSKYFYTGMRAVPIVEVYGFDKPIVSNDAKLVDTYDITDFCAGVEQFFSIDYRRFNDDYTDGYQFYVFTDYVTTSAASDIFTVYFWGVTARLEA